jgi:hypothetical protein
VVIVVQDIEALAKAWAELLGLPMHAIQITGLIEEAQTEYQAVLTLAPSSPFSFRSSQT